MKRISILAASLTALVAVSCGDDAGNGLSTTPLDGTGLTLDSFTVSIVGGDSVEGVIDNEERTIALPGVANGNYISSADFTANLENATFYPSMESKIGKWEKEFNATLLAGGKGAQYTITLPDYDRGDNNILVVDPTDTKQEILFIGADMERSQHSLWKAANAQEMADWCFKDIAFPVLRVSYDKQQEMVEGEKNFAFYDSCLKTMKLIENSNPNIKYWATLKSDYNGYDKENNYPDWISNYSTKSLNIAKYAKFLVDYLEYFHQQGHTISYMSTSKEYTQVNNAERTKQVIEAMIPDLEARGVPVPLFNDASTWSVAQGADFVNDVVKNNFANYYWGFCTHNYQSGDGDRTYKYENFTSAINKANNAQPKTNGEKYYAIASETGAGTMGPNKGVDADSDMETLLGGYREKCEIFADGMHGELIFEIFSRGVSGESRAVYCNYNSADKLGKRLSHYYALKSHGNFCKPGMKYLGATQQNMRDDIYTMQFANDEYLYLCVINSSAYEIESFLIDLYDTAYNGDIEYHVMDKQTVKIDGDLDGNYYTGKLKNGTFDVEIPAMSISFYNIKLDKTESVD